jgi:hypothetical protein
MPDMEAREMGPGEETRQEREIAGIPPQQGEGVSGALEVRGKDGKIQKCDR